MTDFCRVKKEVNVGSHKCSSTLKIMNNIGLFQNHYRLMGIMNNVSQTVSRGPGTPLDLACWLHAGTVSYLAACETMMVKLSHNLHT